MWQSFECCGKKIIGKPCEGEPHARFDEGRMKFSSAYSTWMTCERTLIFAQSTLWIAPQNLQFTLWNSRGMG